MTYRRLDVSHYGRERWANIEARVVAIDPNEAGLPTPLVSRALTGVIAGTALTGFITEHTQPREGEIKVHLVEADITLELAEDMHSELKRLTVGLQRLANANGEPVSFGVQCVRFAIVTGCVKVAVRDIDGRVLETIDMTEAALAINELVTGLRASVTK